MLKSVNGFTAIEMAIVLSVSAMVLGGGLAASKPVIEKMQHKKTERQMEKINDQLASYVHRNNRLPCPADPSASTLGDELSSCATNAVGLVPFRTLGLSEGDVRDSWGNLISYHVSPAFAVNPADVGDKDHDKVHEFCRSENWVTDPMNMPGYERELKSNFYCGYQEVSLTEGINMYEESGKRLYWSRDPDNSDRGTNSLGGGVYGEPAGRAIGAGENMIFETDNPLSSLIFGLTSLKGEVGANITFHVWGALDAADDDYVELSIDITEDMVSDLTEETDVYHIDVNADDIDGIDEFHKIRIVVSNGPNGDISYAIKDLKGSHSDHNETVNVNPAKARFCCPMAHVANYSPATDLEIVDENNKRVVPQSRSGALSKYDDKDIEVPGSVSSDIFVPALALISHGKNGHGAFLANGTSGRVVISATVGEGFGEDEVKNADGNKTYVYRSTDRTNDATYFDDIVMWRTQDQIYSEFGNQSCQTP